MLSCVYNNIYVYTCASALQPAPRRENTVSLSGKVVFTHSHLNKRKSKRHVRK